MRSSTRRTRSANALPLAALGLLASSACQNPLDLPPITYETERARIGTTFDDPLCAGDLAWFDQHVENIERLAGVTRSKPVEIYINGNDTSPPVPLHALWLLIRRRRPRRRDRNHRRLRLEVLALAPKLPRPPS